ncbi:MAG: HAMP domain-containing histidine kinase [Clostridiales bacterium]|jgi:K+-sensing histidine kinase KdpD|nr:HAMP domain-containing histidine kinase [Clostridiales bacterium]
MKSQRLFFPRDGSRSESPEFIMCDNIFHDMKTPLSLMYMNIQLLEKLCDDNDNVFGHVKSLKNNWFQIMKMVNDASDSLKIMSGEIMPVLKNHDIIKLIIQIAESAKLLSGRKNVHFTFKCDAEKKIMAIDKEIVERITLNLLSNAYKRSPEGGEVTLEALDYKSMFVIKTRDDGSSDDMEKIWRTLNAGDAFGPDIPKSYLWFFVVRQLAGLIGGDALVQDGAKGGVETLVTLPVMLLADDSPSRGMQDSFYNDNIFQIELSDDYY